MNTSTISKKKISLINLLFNYSNAIFVILNSLVLVPLYLKHFSLNTYGSFLSSGNIVGMLGLLEGGISMVFTQKLAIYFAKRDFKSFSRLLGSGLFISAALSCLLILIGLGLLPFISDWVKAESIEYKNIQYAFLLSAIGAGLSISYSNIAGVFQAWMKVQIHGVTNLISISLGIISTLLGLKFGMGVISIPFGIFVRSLIGVIVLLVYLNNILKKNSYPPIKIDRKDCFELVKSALPVFGGNIGRSLVTNSQLLIITNFINPASAAIFVITGKVYAVCESFLAPIGSSIFSSISQLVGEGENEKIKKNLINIFILFTAFAALILSSSFAFNKTFITLWLGMDKFGGFALSGLMCLTMLFNTRFNFLSFNLFALGIFGKTVLYDQICGALRLILIFILIGYIGFIAIPIAELLSTSIIMGFFINKLLIKKLNLNHFESYKFIFTGSTVIGISILVSILWLIYFNTPNSWLLFMCQLTLFVGIIGIIIYLTTSEVRNMFNSIFARLG